MNEEMIIKLQHFFGVDMKIKKEMYDMAPLDNLEGKVISDKINDSLFYIFSELKCISYDLNLNVYKKVCSLEDIIKEQFYSCGYDTFKLKKFYQKYISNMEEKFVDCVMDTCVGYSSENVSAIYLANSINEILHFLHSYIINNEKIFEAVPLIEQKMNDNQYPIRLRGNKNSYFEQLFKLFPLELDCGWTDMVIINDKKMIMMVRDRGHALTIEITLNNDSARIEYFIPKLCNINMIKMLPGINPVNENSYGATGAFETDLNNLPSSLISFISKVPTDLDIILR